MPITRAYTKAGSPLQGLANPVINGGMDIWQRGTSFTMATSNNYTADRWNGYRGVAGGTVSRQATGDTTNLPFIQYAARVQRDSGNTSTSGVYFGTSIENFNSIPFAGKTITLSFYARAGANYSSASSVLTTEFATGTNTDANYVNGSSSGWTKNTQVNTLTTTWTRFTQTITVPTTAVQLAAQFQFIPVGTAGAADYFEVTGVQVDIGSYTAATAPEFRRSGGTLAGELAACQRYYWRQTNNSNNQPYGAGPCISTTSTRIWVQFPVEMRVNPTSVDYSNLGVYDGGAAVTAATSVSINANGKTSALMQVDVASGLTQYRSVVFLGNNTSHYLGFSAEL